MNATTRSLFVIFICILTTACATSTNYKLSRGDAAEIKSTKLIVVVPEDHLDAEVEHSNISQYSGGGLLFALVDVAVDSSREHDVQSQIAPIQAALKDSGVAKSASEILAGKLRDFEKLKVTDVEIVAKDQAKSVSAIETENKSNDILLIKLSNSMSNSVQFLNTQANVSLYLAPSAKSNASSHRRVVQDVYTFGYKLPVAHSSAAENIADWASNNGNEAKLGMTSNASNIAAQIVDMLSESFGVAMK